MADTTLLPAVSIVPFFFLGIELSHFIVGCMATQLETVFPLELDIGHVTRFGPMIYKK